MNKLFILLSAILLASSLTSAQSMKFRAYNSTVLNNETGGKYSVNVDFMIVVNDYIMKLSNGKTWYFYGNTVKTSKTEFYSYAYDDDDKKCRVWFSLLSTTKAYIGVEYGDLSFLYKTYIVSLGIN